MADKKDLQVLKNEALNSLRVAEQKIHKYAAACDLGLERIQAFTVYENIRTATRAGLRVPSDQL